MIWSLTVWLWHFQPTATEPASGSVSGSISGGRSRSMSFAGRGSLSPSTGGIQSVSNNSWSKYIYIAVNVQSVRKSVPESVFLIFSLLPSDEKKRILQTLFYHFPFFEFGSPHLCVYLRCKRLCTDWGYGTSSRKWNRERNSLHQLGQPVAPSILFL